MPQSSEALRIELTNEWHARPRLDLPTLFRCTHILEMNSEGGLRTSREDFSEFCRSQGQPPPAEGARVHSVQAGTCLVKWEGHTECTSHTLIVSGSGTPLFGGSALDLLNESRRQALLDRMFIGIHVEIARPSPDDPSGHELAMSVLGSEEIYGGWMSARRAVVWSAFKLDSSGFARILLIAVEGGGERISRLVQRLLDLESYRMLAMLGLSRARAVMATLSTLEPELDEVMRRLAEDREAVDEGAALARITDVAAKVEHVAADNAYRFAASQAYGRIVEQRSQEVDEEIIDDHQRYTQFLSRSLQPAMRTCASAEERVHSLAERVGRVASMLDTMVEVAQTEQNQRILASLAESSFLQLKLQQAVEGFSIVAISYYAVGLLGYGLKAAKTVGAPIDPNVLTGVAAPLILAGVWLSVWQVRRRLNLRAAESDRIGTVD